MDIPDHAEGRTDHVPYYVRMTRDKVAMAVTSLLTSFAGAFFVTIMFGGKGPWYDELT